MIQKSSALRLMESTRADGSRIPFHVAYITADRAKWKKYQKLSEEDKRKSSLDFGGKLIEHNYCILSGPRGKHATKAKLNAETKQKQPLNSSNRTRNVVMLPARQIRKLHINLITHFNSQEVIY